MAETEVSSDGIPAFEITDLEPLPVIDPNGSIFLESDLTDAEIEFGVQKQDLKQKKALYRVLDYQDVYKCMLDAIESAQTELKIPRNELIRILFYYKWNLPDVVQHWNEDKNGVRQRLGLPSPNIPLTNPNCVICLTRFRETMALYCGHSACKNCWEVYVNQAVSAGSESLMLTCPVRTCNHGVLINTIRNYASAQNRKKYFMYMVKSYVNGHKQTKKCPNPSCSYAIELFQSGNIKSGFDVRCLCLHAWCWNCVQEPHEPMTCATVAVWLSEPEVNKSQQIELMAKNDFERNRAIEGLNELKNVRIKDIQRLYKMYEFIFEAWEQVIECRRVLKWSYARGYYLSGAMKDLFELYQNRAGIALETFQDYVEDKTKSYSFKDFGGLRNNFISYTTRLKQIFDRFFMVIEGT